MSRLERSLFFAIQRAGLAITLAIVALVALVELTEKAAFVPVSEVVVRILPLAAGLAPALVFAERARRLEIVAALALAVPLGRLLRPIVAFGLVAGLADLGLRALEPAPTPPEWRHRPGEAIHAGVRYRFEGGTIRRDPAEVSGDETTLLARIEARDGRPTAADRFELTRRVLRPLALVAAALLGGLLALRRGRRQTPAGTLGATLLALGPLWLFEELLRLAASAGAIPPVFAAILAGLAFAAAAIGAAARVREKGISEA